MIEVKEIDHKNAGSCFGTWSPHYDCCNGKGKYPCFVRDKCKAHKEAKLKGEPMESEVVESTMTPIDYFVSCMKNKFDVLEGGDETYLAFQAKRDGEVIAVVKIHRKEGSVLSEQPKDAGRFGSGFKNVQHASDVFKAFFVKGQN